MSKRLIIEPHALHVLLMDWAFSSFPKGGGLGFPNKCAYLAERTQQHARSFEPWDLSRNDRDEVALAIAELSQKHRLAITRAYKPWCIPTIDRDMAAFAVSDRTWRRWCHEAAQELAPKLVKNVYESA